MNDTIIPKCLGCGLDPNDDPYLRDMAKAEGIEDAREFVRKLEGTYNSSNGHFLCDECYIKAGMPSSPTGWIAP
jgi:hypothetical protein